MNKNLIFHTSESTTVRPRSLSPLIKVSQREVKSGNKTFIKNAYVLPKFKNFTLETPLTKRDASEESVKTPQSYYKKKIAELERKLTADKKFIEKQKQEIVDLNLQLENMRKLNKNLMDGNLEMGGDLHALYQDLFITDLRNQVEDISKNASLYRTQKEEMKNEINNLKKENNKFKATIKRYRAMLTEAARAPKGTDTTDASSYLSAFNYDPGHLTDKSSNLRDGSKPVGLRYNLVSLKKLERANELLSGLFKARNIFEVFKLLPTSLKSILKCEKVTIYINQQKIKDEYLASYPENTDFIGRIRVENKWLLMHTFQGSDQTEPLFTSLNELKYCLREHEHLVMPVHFQKELSLILQFKEKYSSKGKKKAFSPTDESLVENITNGVLFKVNSILSNQQARLEFNKAAKIAKIAGRITLACSHQEIANRVRSDVSEYMDFETAGVAFIDQSKEQFFMMVHDPNSEDYYGNNVIRFPLGMGLSSEVLKKDNILVFSNPKSNSYFNPDVDNVGGSLEVRNILMSPVKNAGGQFVAVVQLTNKKNGAICQTDIARFENLLGMLGGSVASALVSIEQQNITFKTKELIDRISGSFGESEMNKVNIDTSKLTNMMVLLKQNLQTWSISRKTT